MKMIDLYCGDESCALGAIRMIQDSAPYQRVRFTPLLRYCAECMARLYTKPRTRSWAVHLAEPTVSA